MICGLRILDEEVEPYLRRLSGAERDLTGAGDVVLTRRSRRRI